jgi:hypothetical protein
MPGIHRPTTAAELVIDARWLDPIAAQLIAADHDDHDAERALLHQYRNDDGLHPGPVVEQFSPYGHQPIEVSLRRD